MTGILDDLAGIRARAEAATPGPWKAWQDRQWGVLTGAAKRLWPCAGVNGPSTNPAISDPDVVCAMNWSDRFIKDDGANAAHIASADPPTVIAMCDLIERQAGEIARLKAEVAALTPKEDTPCRTA